MNQGLQKEYRMKSSHALRSTSAVDVLNKTQNHEEVVRKKKNLIPQTAQQSHRGADPRGMYRNPAQVETLRCNRK